MPRHVVVDGSNLATEGRALPSLKQLNEAVLAFIEENPEDVVTVVVDATFGHRIDPREVPEFDAAIENNELVAPPAGAVGRGDAFVLTIANKVNATIISNDSYQEFHGSYGWLFDEGRLIGGKPVPNVGWVFVPRVPVRGPVSRRATKESKKAGKAREPRKAARPSKEASRPMPVPSAPPPGARQRPSTAKSTEKAATPKPAAKTDAPTPSRQHLVNELLPFLGFVERHPIGSTVRGVVESYSSHGAYVALGDARGYVPLRLMADPPPRSAREHMKLASEVELVVVSFNPTRRSIDLCVPGIEPPDVKALVHGAPVAKRARKKAAAVPPAAPGAAVAKRSRAKAAPAADAALAAVPEQAAPKRTRKKAPAEPVAAPAKRTRKKAAASETAAAAPPPAAPAKRSRKKATAS